jgi:hypothetical protein
MGRSVVRLLAEIEPARWLVDDPVTGGGHPEFEPGVTGIVLRGRPDPGPVWLAIGVDADESRVSTPSPNSRPRWCSSSTSPGPYRSASTARICTADSVTVPAWPVSVTAATWRGGSVAVAHTRRCATPSLATPAGYCQNGSSATSSPSGGRSSAEAGVRPSIARSSQVRQCPCEARHQLAGLPHGRSRLHNAGG